MDFVGEIGTNATDFSLNIGTIFKIVFSFLFLFYVAYSFFLALRVKILVETVRTPWNSFLRRLAYFHLYAVIMMGGLAFFLIIIA